jgi:hypothetical protein
LGALREDLEGVPGSQRRAPASDLADDLIHYPDHDPGPDLGL